MKGTFPIGKFREMETPFYYYDANLLRETLQTIKDESGKYNKFCVHTMQLRLMLTLKYSALSAKADLAPTV